MATAAIMGRDAGLALDPTWLPPERATVLLGAILPFGMVWAGSALAAIVSRSTVTKYRLGLRPLRVCRAAPIVFAGLMWLAGRGQDAPGAAYLTVGAAFLPISMVGIMPLVAWVRFGMPKTRSMAAWLAYPVVMYCCFWVVLEPIRRDTFPFGLVPDLSAPLAGRSAVVP